MKDQISASFQKLVEKMQSWIDGLVLSLPNLILAIVVLVIASISAKYLRKYLHRLIYKFSHNETASSAVANIGTVVFGVIALFIALGIMNLDKALTSVLAGAGVVGLAIGLALQEPLMNIFSGLIMSVRKLYNVGDLVDSNGYFGIIQHISLRSTFIKTLSGALVSIPNKMVLHSPLVNYNANSSRRVELDCGISYGDNLETVKAIALDTIKENVSYDTSREVEFFYTGFGDSSINFQLRFWLSETSQKAFLDARSKAIMKLKAAFDQNEIVIPFPIRTLDFGIKGGERLDSVLSSKQMSTMNNGHSR